jgi:hypothetical protein
VGLLRGRQPPEALTDLATRSRSGIRKYSSRSRYPRRLTFRRNTISTEVRHDALSCRSSSLPCAATASICSTIRAATAVHSSKRRMLSGSDSNAYRLIDRSRSSSEVG